MDCTQINTEYSSDPQTNSLQASDISYQSNQTVNYAGLVNPFSPPPPPSLPPSLPPPPPPASSLPIPPRTQPVYPPVQPNYGTYDYSMQQSYYSVPVPTATTPYSSVPNNYSYYEYHSQSTHKSQDYYGTSYTQRQSSYNYSWDTNYSTPYQAENSSCTDPWIAETTSYLAKSRIDSSYSKNHEDSKGESNNRVMSNGYHQSLSPDNRFLNKPRWKRDDNSGGYRDRSKERDCYSRYRGRSKERKSSKESSIRRSRSSNRKAHPNCTYGNNSLIKNERSMSKRSNSRNRRSISRSKSRRSVSRSRSRRSPSRSTRRSVSRNRNRMSVIRSESTTSVSKSESMKLLSKDQSRRSNSQSRNRRRSKSQESHSSIQSSSRVNSKKSKTLSERELLLEKYRRNYCPTSEDIKKKLNELESEGVLEKKIWTRTAPADLYYNRDEKNNKIMRGSEKLLELCRDFKKILLERAAAARAAQPPYEPPPRKTRVRLCKHKSEACSSSSDSEDSLDEDAADRTMKELMLKKQHPQRLHPEMWFNDPGEMNDGPLCRCSAKSRRSGIRHGIYAGEGVIEKCDPNSNNADKLFHYRITISPPTNFLTKTPTIIEHDEHEFIFEGFSMLSHFPLIKLPTCKVIRFNIEYTILYIEEKMPENFTIQELDYFQTYLFQEILELADFNLKAAQDKNGCGQFHFMPRFVRDLPDNGQEILSMNEVLSYLIKSSTSLIDPNELNKLLEMPQFLWQNFADEVKGMVVTYPGKKPCSVRVDQLDRNQQADQPPGVTAFPEIVHFGIRPPQLSYAGNTDYQRAWRDYVKFRHLLANMPKPSYEDKRKLELKENKLQELRTQSKMKRDVTVDVTSEGFYRTGIMCDIVQHAMLIPVLVCHLRFHKSLDHLEKALHYEFKNRYLLQLALTHPSYRENFGTNSDHARNSLTNCGIRQPEYGDRRIHYMNTRKRGINTLINIMSRFGAKKETESSIAHNERLEFLGDAVVEFLTSIHLFHMFPDLEEGGLATYRAAIVQNQHLAVLAKKLNLEQYMLYAHGSDLCHDLELRHAMANCFEALMGALFLDGGIKVADTIFGETLFKGEPDVLNIWVNYPKHPLQEQEPTGDRQWIPSFELLQKLMQFENSIGVEFSHIRLLARAFTDRSIGYTNLTLGSNQRLEFLGDTVLQLIVSEYLYKYFPEHHEGHLSLLRSSLVNNKTQAVVCDDLGMTKYALYGNPKGDLKTKDRADLLEAFLGSLYVDKGLEFCQTFCNVCFFPRLRDFIMNQDWNDPKSKLQQCCLTLRSMDGGEPDIPVYKVIECKGPTNTRVYTVAVYFQGKRLAKASGHSIQEAEMNSAKEALEKSSGLFPQLDHQKRVIAKSMKMQNWATQGHNSNRTIQASRYNDRNSNNNSESNQRRRRRSRSHERDKRRSRSRNRYDSVDRRKREKKNEQDNINDPKIIESKSNKKDSVSDESVSNCRQNHIRVDGDDDDDGGEDGNRHNDRTKENAIDANGNGDSEDLQNDTKKDDIDDDYDDDDDDDGDDKEDSVDYSRIDDAHDNDDDDDDDNDEDDNDDDADEYDDAEDNDRVNDNSEDIGRDDDLINDNDNEVDLREERKDKSIKPEGNGEIDDNSIMLNDELSNEEEKEEGEVDEDEDCGDTEQKEKTEGCSKRRRFSNSSSSSNDQSENHKIMNSDICDRKKKSNLTSAKKKPKTSC